ncbi:hypothetical protein CAPTEDRAFT_227023 [Capitella teleta]|uniref:Retinoid-inducible serine carboxypeptidase n=1 Tax=Capitella teleta TaxID=283909 RepID=R7UA36_CAPTE|nr:hypothetical protein CAPTEDRAFT_227023 [Capitella teleta]|eukprot:ELU03230.1 hypothetical protein CAPTEDRAFT_227023 [Capitella teleta]
MEVHFNDEAFFVLGIQLNLNIMRIYLLLLAFLASVAFSVSASTQKWGYVNVRENAHMFWWLYHVESNATDAPLILWLQGGPGSSSTGFGNFQEIGPLDVNLKPRNHSFSGVGTGYSYVTDESAYTTDVSMIAADLVTLFQEFMHTLPSYQKTPFYIFCESYGGKMTAAFAYALHQAIQQGEIKCNFQGVALGDSWISPVDYVKTWGPYLYATSLVGEKGLKSIALAADQCVNATLQGKFTEATELWSKLESVVEEETNGVNFYNILSWDSQLAVSAADHSDPLRQLFMRHVAPTQNDALSDLMNGKVKQMLGIPKEVTWGGQAGQVFEKQAGDFMKPVVDIVDKLLAQTDLQVIVYNGQLDLICDTMGTEEWVRSLDWSEMSAYYAAERHPFSTQGSYPSGYMKKHKQLSFYWILDAGHMVPADAGEAALWMLKDILNMLH